MEVEYDQKLYTTELERDVPRYRGNPGATAREALARQLGSIQAADIGGCHSIRAIHILERIDSSWAVAG